MKGKYILFIAILVMAMSSCVTQQRCLEKFPTKDSISISSRIVYKDTLIHDTLRIPGKEVSIHDTLPCPELNFHKEIKEDGLKHTIDIKNGVLNSKCEADSLKKVISILVKEKQIITDQLTIKNQPPIEVNNLTSWQEFLIVCGYLFWISWLLFAIFTAIRIYLKSTTGK